MLGKGNIIGLEDLGKIHTTTVHCVSLKGLLISINVDKFVSFIREIKKMSEISTAVDKANKTKIKSLYQDLSIADFIKREDKLI